MIYLFCNGMGPKTATKVPQGGGGRPPSGIGDEAGAAVLGIGKH